MKKITALLIAVIMVCSLAACSTPITITIGQTEAPKETAEEIVTEVPTDNIITEATETATVSQSANTGKSAMTTEEFYTFIKDYVDISHYREPTINERSCSLFVDSQYKPEYVVSSDIQLFSDLSIKIEDDTVINLPMKTADLINQGWSFEDNARANAALDAGRGDVMCYFVKGGKRIRVTCSNFESSPVKYSETTITDLKLEFYSEDYNYANELPEAVKFDLDGKINRESNLKSIIDTLGDPSYHVDYTRTGDNIGTDQSSTAKISLEYMDIGFGYYKFYLSSDGSTLVGVDITT